MSNKKPLLNTVKEWVNERTGLITFFSEFLHEEIPGGTRFSYTLGSACMFLLTMQIVSGIWQLFYYVPTVDYAYSSLNYLRLQVPFGWLIHGIHYWGGTLFTIIVGLHCLRVFIWGSYKKPREMVWLIGIVLIVLTALFMFTGPVLPWDKDGFFAGQVGIGIAGSVPIVGPITQAILQGANKMGQMALLRMYVLHVAILPAAIGAFVMLHLVAFRTYGESGPWDEKKRKGAVGYFWPEQIFKDVVVTFLIFLLLVYLSAFCPAPFSGLADPSDTLVSPKPAWPFLFLYQILKLCPGPLEPLGTAGVPLIIILLFASLPFADKSPEKNPFKRGFVILCGFAFVGIVLYLTYLGYIYRSDAEKSQMEAPVAMVSHNKEKVALSEKYTALVAADADKQASGKKLFKTLGCTECHTVTGVAGNKQGPDLLMAKGNNRSRDWLYTQIISPQTHNATTIMPPFAHLSEQNIDLLVAYLQGSTPPPGAAAPKVSAPAAGKPAASGADSVKNGEQLFNTMGCVQCHTIQGTLSNKLGPDLIMAIAKDKPSKDWLKTQLMTPQAHNPASVMPSFSSRLNDAQMSDMVNFLSSLATRKPTAAPAGGAQPAVTAQDQESAGPAASGASGVQATGIIGNSEHGQILFHQSCIMCHGPQGAHPQQPGVPVLNPIDHAVYNVDPQIFAQHIDQYIQHGIPNTVKGGPDMPAFGDSHALTQAQIADLEAYVLSLNGVDRTMIMNPGIEPKEFFYMLLSITSVIVMLAALYWFLMKLLKI